MSRIKHLLFDCDGVLVDTEYTAAVKMSEALQKLGIDISVDYYLKTFSGTTFSSIVKNYFANTINESEVIALVNKVEEQVTAEVKLIHGVEPMLASIDVAKSVVSNSSMRTVTQVITATSIQRYFAAEIFSSELVDDPKPAPDVYNLAIDTLGYATTELLVVEDSLSGATAALAAGLEVIGFVGGSHILPGHGQQLLNLGVKQLADNMADLASILKLKLKE